MRQANHTVIKKLYIICIYIAYRIIFRSNPLPTSLITSSGESNKDYTSLSVRLSESREREREWRANPRGKGCPEIELLRALVRLVSRFRGVRHTSRPQTIRSAAKIRHIPLHRGKWWSVVSCSLASSRNQQNTHISWT